MIITPEQLPDGLKTSCDVVVVGTGAGGGAAAAVLAEGGAKVILLEAGRRFLPQDLKPRASWGYANLYQGKGVRITRGNVFVPVMSGEAVGGGTFVNSAICFRAADDTLSAWARDFGLDFAHPADMAPVFAEVERDIDVRKTEPTHARGNNLIFKRGVDALGWKNGDFISRNAPGCVGCGVCQFGCPVAGKGSVDRNYLPRAVRHGAAIYTQAKVDRVMLERGGATGVSGSFDGGKSFEIRARQVVLAGGAFGTPLVLMRSGLGGESGHLGRNLHIHPCVGTTAFFPDPVHLWDGVTQGYYVDDFAHGIALETFSATPEVFFSVMPRKTISPARTKFLAAAGAMIRDESSGWFTPSGDDIAIHYNLGDADRRRVIEGLRRVAQVFFAAGAQEVLPGLPGVPLQSSPEATLAFLTDDVPANRLPLQASHPQGTARMAADPRQGVVRPDGRVHGTENLWVADATLFPTAVGVNPQVTIMAFAKVIARNVLRA
jgi:choline dehydrogenase-like flavoprotein